MRTQTTCWLIRVSLAVETPAAIWAAESGVAQDPMAEGRRADLDQTMARLQELGLLITADPKKDKYPPVLLGDGDYVLKLL